MTTSSGGHALSTEIGFDYDAEATRSAVGYLLRKHLSVAEATMCNLLFIADRRHLLRFGRPITGDDYEATPTGPAPMKTAPVLGQMDVNDYKPDLLSKSDVLILDQVVCEYRGKSEQELASEASSTLAYQKAWRKAQELDRHSFPMYFEDFFADAPDCRDVLEELLEEQRMRRMFPDLLTF